jgi:hypothetical protein
MNFDSGGYKNIASFHEEIEGTLCGTMEWNISACRAVGFGG